MLAEKLERVGIPASPRAEVDDSRTKALGGGAGPAGRTLADTPAIRSRPRPLDPVPPLYRPPPRDLPLQPILVEKRGVPLDGLPRPSPLRRDPLADDPLRRIDPLTGRDPLGRPERRLDLDAERF